MDDKLYILTCDGYTEDYGSEIYVVGVFTTEEQAKNARDKAISQMKDKLKEVHPHSDEEEIEDCEYRFSIMPVVKNKAYPLEWEEYNGFVNDNFIGGYIE